MDLFAVADKLRLLYGEEEGRKAHRRLVRLVEEFQREPRTPGPDWLRERDVVLITYGDSIVEEGLAPLRSLARFARSFLTGLVSAIHILPFYPYSSDDGFAVIDYWQVSDQLGSWADISDLAQDFDLMFDAVVNHISAQSQWFQKYLAGDPAFQDFFITCDPGADLAQVIRPRALPLLTPFVTSQGEKHLWTTFSADQIDLNYKNPEVLLKMVELLLFYVKKGARYLRLDAVGFLWKELGTSCLHLPQTHWIIQIFRAVLDQAAPGTLLITETNVPHRDNISYFGDGTNEAHLVYQFPLPPLTLYSFLTGDASKLTAWAASLEPCSKKTSFFNFLASHDGIGLLPVQGILEEAELQLLLDQTQAHGGLISYRNSPAGSLSPYELNISYLNALSHPEESPELKAKRFLAAHAILLSLQGVPGIYIHSLLGSENYWEGYASSGIKRRINRQKLERAQLERELADPASLRSLVFTGFGKLLKTRRSQPAFHPNAPQRILDLGPELFTVLRGQGPEAILCLINVTGTTQRRKLAGISPDLAPEAVDLLTGRSFALDQPLTLEPYEILWLKSRP